MPRYPRIRLLPWLFASLLSAAAHAQASTALPASAGAVPPLSQEEQGDLYSVRGQYAAALNAYELVRPRTAGVWNKMGMVHHHFFALDAAGKDYRAALRLDPGFAAAYNNLGAVYYAQRQLGAAEKAYRHAIRCDPRMAAAYENLGTTYFAESRQREGTEAYKKALSLDPEVFRQSPLNHIEEGAPRQQRIATAYSVARAYAGAGREQEALEGLQRAIQDGFSDRRQLLRDPEFSSMRALPAFRQLLAGGGLDRVESTPVAREPLPGKWQ